MSKVIKSDIHLSDKIENTERKFGSAKHYYPVLAVSGDKRVPLLFTISQIRNAAKRALKNPEDVFDLQLDDDVKEELLKELDKE